MFAGLLLLIAWFTKDWLTWDHLEFTTTGDEAMLLGAQTGFLGKSQFQDLSALVLGHAFLERLLFSMVATDDNAKVRTWASFNIDGQRKVCFTSDIRSICPTFFNNVKLDGANTWVLKVTLLAAHHVFPSGGHPAVSVVLLPHSVCSGENTRRWGNARQLQLCDFNAVRAWATSLPAHPPLKCKLCAPGVCGAARDVQ